MGTASGKSKCVSGALPATRVWLAVHTQLHKGRPKNSLLTSANCSVSGAAPSADRLSATAFKDRTRSNKNSKKLVKEPWVRGGGGIRKRATQPP